MRIRASCALAVLSPLFGCILLASSAAAQQASEASQAAITDETSSAERAEALAEQAYQHYSNQEFSDAVAAYLEAYGVSPSAAILYNVAVIYDTKLKDRALAQNFYRRYVADPGAEPRLVSRATERLVTLRETELAVRETEAAMAQTQPAAPAQGQAGSSSSAGGDPSWLASRGPRLNDQDSSSELSSLQVAGIVAGGLGIAGLAVGAGFGIAAKNSADEANALCDGNLCRTQQGVDTAESAAAQANVATLAFAAGGALVVTGLLMIATGGGGSEEQPPMAAGGLHLQPYINVTGAGLTLEGAF